jgi:hypothetical protein
MSVKFFACPAHRCSAPGRFFTAAANTLAFARQAATTYHVGYTAWSVRVGRWTLLARFSPDGGDQSNPTKETDR